LVELIGSIETLRTAGIGATLPLPRVSPKVPSQSDLQTFTIVRCKPPILTNWLSRTACPIRLRNAIFSSAQIASQTPLRWNLRKML
jgi:hypothetical protein